jgi:uncharacterized protein involved in exopolysaccharide biosynthesis
MPDNVPSSSNSQNEIDIRDIILPLWKSRKKIIFTALFFAVLGGIIGFLTPATYTASSTFLPQTAQEAGGLSGSLGGLASLAGINLNVPISGGDIPPSMYTTVLASEPFRMQILDSKIWVNSDSVTYRSYLENIPSSKLGLIKEYTIGLPIKFIGFLSTKKEEIKSTKELKGIQTFSDKEYGFLNAVSGKVSIVNDKKEGLITISVIENDPLIAAQVTLVTEKVLQNWIREHKIKNAKAQYDFIAKQFEVKQIEFFAIQEQLAGYMDRNQNVLSATYLTRLERLQSEFDLVKTVYSELAKQKEQAAIQLNKETPTFSVLDPVKVPKVKTAPIRSLYVLVGFFIGIVLSSGWFLGNKPIKNFFKELNLPS